MAKIAFYEGTSDRIIAVLGDDGSVPREGELINIQKTAWRVRRVTWAVDNAGDAMFAKLRANVELEPIDR